jgi:hypothetical protein
MTPDLVELVEQKLTQEQLQHLQNPGPDIRQRAEDEGK